MSKIFTLLFLSFSLVAQVEDVSDEDSAVIENPSYEYVSLADNKVYDIEIIVFAYRNALPNSITYHNAPIFDDSQALHLDMKPEDFPEIEYVMFQNPSENTTDKTESTVNTDTDSKYTIPLDESEDNKQVLVWFEHSPDDFKLTPIWDRLVNKASIVPLLHKSWRQPETPFDDPTYVKIDNLIPKEQLTSPDIYPNDSYIEVPENPEIEVIENTAVLNSVNIDTNGQFISKDETDDFRHENRYADFSLTGMVALSQGRFMHFGHQLNLFRTYISDDDSIKNMIFSLTERKQLDTDELNYYDSPWFGSIVKITEYTGEQEDEQTKE